VKLGLLAVLTKPGRTSYIEASEVVYITPAANQSPDGPKTMIRLGNHEEAFVYDDAAEVAAQYAQLLERRYPNR
jgi:hypothetical protein